MTYWATHSGQTPERIAAAIQRLKQINPENLHLDEGLKANYVIVRRALLGDESAKSIFFDRQQDYYQHNVRDKQPDIATQTLWSTLMPWENDRALRMANLITRKALDRMRQLSVAVDAKPSDHSGEVGYFLPPQINQNPTDFFYANGYYSSDASLTDEVQWLWTTNPNLTIMGDEGLRMGYMLVDFETAKRATLITLALAACRSDNGKLPDKLSDLVDKYLDQLPRDPYSQLDFAYFPSGIPAPTTPEERDQFSRVYWYSGSYTRSVPGVSCLWSPGSGLRTETWWPNGEFEPDGTPKKGPSIVFYVPRNSRRDYYQFDEALPKYAAWANGWWFPIPPAQK